MKKTKILTVMGVLLAMGITACGGNNKKSSSVEPQPSSSQPAPSSSVAPSSSSVAPSSSSSVAPTPTKDATGHIWGADADVAASGEGVAYKKATCTENDGFIKLTINQSAVTYASGSSRKENTPEGYTKLDGNGQSMSAKFNYDHYAEGKLYLFGCMDGWGSNASKKAFSYNGSPNVEIKVNGEALDIAALSDVVYTDFLSGDASDYSDDGYALIGNIKLDEGVNEVSYKRLASMNTLVKDFVFVIENKTKPAHVHTADTEWHKDATNHWHECTAGDGYKMDSAAHTFGEWVETASAQPCKTKGTKVRTCSVCGYEETGEIDLAEHTWVADTSKEDVPATCIAGKHFEKCSVCGETREVAIPKDPDAAHDFGAWEVTKEPSCAQGQKKRTCSRCGMEEFDVIAPVEGAKHVWGEKTTVPAVTHVDDTDPENPKTVVDYAGYEKQECSVCGTWKVSMKVSDATLGQGSTLKTDDFANTGGYKLKSNNNYFEFKLKFETIADVKIYQLGCMDNWHSESNNNRSRTYKSGGSNGGCNFKFTVNGKDIEIDPATADAKAEDLVPDREDGDPLKTITCPSGGTGYSAFAELLIGEAELIKGDNTLRYTRLGSYNYIVSDLVFEVTPYDHEHVASENWVDTDETYHWKNCTHSDGHKMEKAKHDYTGQEWEVVTESTCTVKGTHRRSCKVCGHWQVEEMDLAEHIWVEDTTQYVAPGHNPGKKVEICSECNAVREVAIPATEPHEWTEGTAENGITPLSCACGQVGMQFDGFTGDNAGNIEGTKVNKGKTFTWTLTMPKAGKVAVSIHMAYGSGKGSKKIGSASSYVLKCGDNNGSISVNDETYAALLGDKDSVYSYLEFGTVNVPAGQATITFTYGNQNDRLLSDKLVRIIYLD